MKMSPLFVFLLSGLSALSTSITREYHYLEKLKTWAEAQSYCRKTFTDLATVDNRDENNKLLSVLPGHGNFAWIGLHEDLTKWKWALGNSEFNNIHYSNWKANYPNNKMLKQICVVMTKSGTWYYFPCCGTFPAVCYYEQGPARYILVKTEMTWEQAKAHCRSSYTDLVSVRNSTENALVSSLVSQKTWIGLHRKNWDYWSDQSPVTFTNWSSNQPDKRGNSMELCAVVNTTTGTWSVVDCSSKHYFICENVKVSSKMMMKFKFQSEADMKDPAAQQQVLEQLHAKLQKNGLSDFKLRWIERDGQIFHKERKRNIEEGSGM